jgi:hypothetical protein
MKTLTGRWLNRVTDRLEKVIKVGSAVETWLWLWPFSSRSQIGLPYNPTYRRHGSA